MDNFAEKKNSEGYSDPTPYQAIKNMIKPGEIWTFQKKDNTEAEVLVVAFGDSIATILYLMDEYKDGCIEVVSNGVKWANPRMLNWAWGGYLNKRVRKLSTQEFNQIGVELEKVFAVKIGKESDSVVNYTRDQYGQVVFHEIEEMKNEMEALRAMAKESDSVACKYHEAYEKACEKANNLNAKLEVMKEMYSDLMEKYLKGA